MHTFESVSTRGNTKYMDSCLFIKDICCTVIPFYKKNSSKESEPKTTMKLMLMMSACELQITTVKSESAFHTNNQSAH